MTKILVFLIVAAAIKGQTPHYDLLLQGGHVIDPANGINERMDVAVAGRNIAAVEKNIPQSNAGRVVNVSGLYVAPGFIDIHGHYGLGRPGSGDMHPPDMNLSSGMTTMVDAGTWGADDFDVMKRTIIDRSRIRVLAFINIVSAGMTEDAREQDPKLMDAARCAEAAKKYKDVIVGIKTAHYWTSQPLDKEHPIWAAVDR